jgi:hypothetical protein
MTTKILGEQITAYTIDTVQLSNTATAAFAKTLAPKVLYANVASNTFTVLDDTAVNVGGGYIVVTGAEFQSGAQVLIDTTPAAAVTYVNSTTLRVQVPTKTASSYNLYVVNPDGGVGIKVAGITYSSEPTWVTTSPLDNLEANTAFGVNLSATGASSYAVAAGSTLPAGTTLSSNGYFFGTVTIETQTTYSFTVTATDAENQDANKTFSVTVTVDPPDPYFNYTTLLLQADGVSNNSINSTFVDSSNNAYAVTSSGTPVQGSQNPFGVGNWSNFFSSSHLENGSDNVGLRFGTGDFTVECWVYPTLLSAGDRNIIEFRAGASTFAFRFGISGASTPFMAHTSGLLNGSYSFSVNQWYHMALTRQSGTTTIWVNGVSAGSGTVNNDFTQGYLRVGNDQSNGYFVGYISNLRVLKGQALYTTTFTPSTTPLTAIANTQLLTCQSNSFKDSSNNAFALTVSGTPVVDRLNPFGVNVVKYDPSVDTGSIFFNGTTDYLNLPNSTSNLNGDSSNFTVDGWVYTNSSVQQNIVYLGGDAGTDAGIRLEINGGGSRALQILASVDGSNWAINYNAGSLQLNAWNHIALCRSGSSWFLFINGVQAGSTQTLNATLYAGPLNQIGAVNTGGVSNFFSGYMSNIRFIKGTALYTSNFTPPATPSTPISNTQLLLLGNNAGIYDATLQNNIQISGDAKVRTDVAKYGTGSMYFDSSGDYLTVPHNNNINLNTGDFTIEAWVYFNSIINASAILYKGPLSGSYYGSYLIYISSGGAIDFYTSSSGSGWTSGISPMRFTSNASTGAWHHLAITRSGNTFRTFFNGASGGGATSSENLGSQTDPLHIGVYSGGTLNGYIDDLRITKGYARYTAPFTPPTAKLPSK